MTTIRAVVGVCAAGPGLGRETRVLACQRKGWEEVGRVLVLVNATLVFFGACLRKTMC